MYLNKTVESDFYLLDGWMDGWMDGWNIFKVLYVVLITRCC